MAFWLPNDKYNPSIWISVFLVIPVLFNMFNVRRYGEIEFWLTVIKLITIVGLIVLGILLPMNASPTTRLLGTDLDTLELVECPSSDVVSGNVTCVGTPGFGCTSPSEAD
jgi:amino acid permease